jgi:hypothetical protein
MSYLGVLFSLDKKTVDQLKSFSDDEDRLDYLQGDIEEIYFEDHPEWVCELDKAWDAIHRTLTDGNLEWKNGEYPLNHFILGGEILYSQDDYIISLKSPQQVSDIYNALAKVTAEQFKEKYLRIDKKAYETSDEDLEYTWEWFDQSREFWKRAAADQRYVLFTADQ